MPEITGIEFLDSFTFNRPNVVITTAYPQYAIDGFEHDVVDYLLKPISLSRFMKAINKLMEKFSINLDFPEEDTMNKDNHLLKLHSDPIVQSSLLENENLLSEKFFMVKEDKKLIKVNISDIVFVEGMKDYVKIHLFNQFIVTHITMTKIVCMLPKQAFIRISRSFVVKVSFIKLIEGNMIEMLNKKKLPIGINYREAVKEALHHWLL